jgi:hypothetical protein
MKRFLLSLFFAAGFSSLMAQTAPASTTQADALQLKETTFNFGKIQQGRPVTHVFELVNTGKEAIKLEDVQASCGCTTPEWSRDLIQPGAKSTIKVGYNAAAEGDFSKTVTITYQDNGQKHKALAISGNVYTAPPTPAPLNSSISLLKQNQ